MSLEGVQPANNNEMPAVPAAEAAPAAEPVVAPTEAPAAVEPAPASTEKPALPEVKEEAKPEEKAEASEDLPYESTGNEYMDNVLSAFHEGGVDFDKAFGNFSESGKEEDIDLEYIESIIGRAATQGILAGVKAENAKMEADAVSTAEAVHKAAGSKELWDGACSWIASGKSGLTKEGWDQYNTMLAAGGIQSELAARELSKMYQQSPGFTKPANLMEGDATAQPSSVEPISRRQYAEELNKVVRTNGENSPEAQLLHQRRQVAMQRGV